MKRAEKVSLPSISNFIHGMPAIEDDKKVIPSKVDSVKPLERKKCTTYFSPLEDVAIFKTILYYYGNNPIEKLPWAFWELYRRSTGSNRSDSSLYHHWNGSIQKKYGKLIKTGLIIECIRIAESNHEIKNCRFTSHDCVLQSGKKNLSPAPTVYFSPYSMHTYASPTCAVKTVAVAQNIIVPMILI